MRQRVQINSHYSNRPPKEATHNRSSKTMIKLRKHIEQLTVSTLKVSSRRETPLQKRNTSKLQFSRMVSAHQLIMRYSCIPSIIRKYSVKLLKVRMSWAINSPNKMYWMRWETSSCLPEVMETSKKWYRMKSKDCRISMRGCLRPREHRIWALLVC